MANLKQALALELFEYNPDTGVVTNRVSRGTRAKAGERAGCVCPLHGYRKLRVGGQGFQEHRVIWLLHTGKEPECEIDHINGDRTDNRWVNLRLADKSQNQHNKGLSKANTSGVKGLSVVGSQWRAGIRNRGEVHYKYFPLTEEGKTQAEAWLVENRARLHGEYARSN